MTRYHALIRDGAVEMREGTMTLYTSELSMVSVTLKTPNPSGIFGLTIMRGDWDANWHATPALALAALRARCRDEVERAEAALRDARERLGVVEKYEEE